MYVSQQRSARSHGLARAFDVLILLMNGAGVLWFFALTRISPISRSLHPARTSR